MTYNQNAIELEAFSRPLWALVPFWVGGGSDPEFEKIYRKGLAAGTDPENPEYWGTTGEYDQCYVEMAAIACGILTAPEKLWTPLSDTEKQNLAAWLGQINAHTIPDCNWQFFRILVNLALKKRGDALQPGNCWRMAFAKLTAITAATADPLMAPPKGLLHPVGHPVLRTASFNLPPTPTPRRRDFTASAPSCSRKEFVYWFDVNGGTSALWPRTSTYRGFAQNSFWAACIWAGLEPPPCR